MARTSLAILSIAVVIAALFGAGIGYTAASNKTALQTLLPPVSEVAKPENNVGSQQTTTLPAASNTTAMPENASEGDPRLVTIFKQTENSIVQITTKVSHLSRNIIINGNPLESKATLLGSGFIYDSDGRVVTNNHVVEGADSVDVTFIDGNTYSATVVGKDPYSDIAVLQVTDDGFSENLVPLKIGDSFKLQVGEQVIAIGNPGGLSGVLTNTMTTGIVSQLGRLLPNPDFGFSIPNAIQTDAAINHGNSGGPLLNMKGEVVGVNTAIQSSTGEFAGIGFAIPSSTLTRIVPALIADGSYSHPWLGISGANMTPDLAQSMSLPKNYKGALIGGVVKGGPADRAELKSATQVGGSAHGDIVTAIDGHPVKSIDDIISYVEEAKQVGDTVTLKVNRDGQQMVTLEVTLEARPGIIAR